MINLGKFFIENKILILLITLSFLISGIFSFFNLNRNEDPGFKIRTAAISTKAEGINAGDVDNFITKPIENILLNMDEIEDVISKSYSNQSAIFVHLYEKYNEIQPIWDKLRRKIELVKPKIPDGLNPVVNDEYGDVYGGLIGISKENSTYEELYDITNSIRNEFLKLKTRGKVEIFGTQDEAVYLYFTNPYLTNLKLTPVGLKNFIQNQNVIKGGGQIETKTNSIEISSDSKFKTLDDIKNTIIDINSKPLALNSYFKIEKTTKEPKTKEIRLNGKEGLIIGISLKENGNILKWGEEIENKVKELKEKYKNTEIEIYALQSEYVKKLTSSFISSLYESITAVILIVMAILGIKAGFIAGGIILITILSTFTLMNFLNIGLDKISLSALIISLGILVDNSVVITQGIMKDNIEKEKIKEKIITTVQKFQIPLFIASITTSCSFLPVYFAKSMVSEYTSSLFKVILITLLFSWFYSVTLLPYLLYEFYKNKDFKKKNLPFAEFIKNKIEPALYHSKTVVLAGTVLFLLSFCLFALLPKIFFPDSDRNMFEIKINLKEGTNFNETKNATIRIENYLKERKNIENFSSFIGTSAPRYVLSASPDIDNINSAIILVNTKNYKVVPSEIKNAKNFINKNLINVQSVVRKIPLGPPYDAPIEIRIMEDDINLLYKYAKIVEKELAKEKSVYLVKNNWGNNVVEYRIKVNENSAIMAGISPYELFDYLNTYYNGKILTYYYRGDIKIPVILKGDKENLIDIDSISMHSKSKNGTIPLKQIASIKTDFSPSKIFRKNNSYTITVQGWNDETKSAKDISKNLAKKLDRINGLKYEFGGILEKSKKGNASIIKEIPKTLFIIFFILCIYFKNFLYPILAISCGFLALTGGNIGLFITNSSFGFITFLGFICLVGICTNNGVILLSELKNNAKIGLIETTKSRVEAILLTNLTTISGMAFLWLKNDPMFSTLGISTIFGLISSFFITIFFLPSFIFLCLKKFR